MKKTNQIKFVVLLSCLLGFAIISFGQNFQKINTKYSRTNNGGVGSENFSFSMSGGMLSITDLDYSRRETYGPLKFEGSGFENGYYYDGYTSDIRQDPLRYRSEKPRAYKIYYDRKNGSVLAILEGKILPNNSQTIKIYYTELGNRSMNGTSEINSTNNSNFDIYDVILNYSTINSLMAKINFSFEQFGDKKKVLIINSFQLLIKMEVT